MEKLKTTYVDVTKAAQFRKVADAIIASGQPFGFDIETGFAGEPGHIDKIAVKPMHPDWVFVSFSLAYAQHGWAVDPRSVNSESRLSLRFVPADKEGNPDINATIPAFNVPIAHDEDTGTTNVDDVVEVAKALWDLLQTGNCVAHNASFELKGTGRWFRDVLGDDPEYGPKVRADYGIFPVKGDSQLLIFCADLWQGATPKHVKGLNVGLGLKENVMEVFGHKMIEFGELFKDFKLKKTSHQRFNILTLNEQVKTYACEDAVWCLQLWLRALDEIKHDTEVNGIPYSDTAYQLELELLPVVARMDQQGIPLDWNYLQKKLTEVEGFKDKMNEEILVTVSEMLGDDVTNVNLASPKQVAELLYDKLKIEPPRERGEYTRSTAEKPLESIAKSNQVVRDILTYRTVVKLVGSYLKKYLGGLRWNREDASPYSAKAGCAYPSHNATGAISGRFSVDVMSYQQLPKPYYYQLKTGEEYHLAFREVITAPEGFRIVGFDYSQIQLRMMAGFAQEKAMLNAFARGTDIHIATASSMLGIPIDQVTDKQRSIGKAQPLYERVLTPTGWKTMRELRVGDEVTGSDGKATKITGVFPQEGKRPIYRVHTSDGGYVDMDEEHYLLVENKNNRGTWKKRTLSEIMRKGIREGKGTYTQAKWRLPDRPVVEYSEYPELPIDPYFLGLLLGDGGFRGMSAAYFASSDPELQEYVRGIAGEHDVECVVSDIRDYGTVTYNFVSSGHNTKNPLSYKLRELGLWGVKCADKFIPELYLRARPEDRLALLQGLMDTDGYVSYSGAGFAVSSVKLVEGAQELARSLGGHASKRTENTSGRASTLPDGRIITTKLVTHKTQITLPSGASPFRLTRKATKLKKRHRENRNWISDVEYVGEYEAQCISVEAEDGLYISNGYSVISNTLNFAITFGQGPDALANSLTTPDKPVTIDDAVKLLKQYYAGFPGLASWMRGLQDTASRKEPVVGLFGRRYRIWEKYSDLAGVRNKGDRTAINEPVQGAEALYAKRAMIQADRAIREAGLQDKIKLVIMVHDALEFFVHESVSTQEVIDLLDKAVSYSIEEQHPNFPVIKSDWHEGPNLGALVEIDLDDAGKISGYSMKMEVVGSPTVKWEGTSFSEVFEKYEYWRNNEHPEVLGKLEARAETLEAVRKSMPAEVVEEVKPRKFEIRMKEPLTAETGTRLIELMRSKPGVNTYEIVRVDGVSVPLRNVTSNLNETDAGILNLRLGRATINEVFEADAFDDTKHPF